MTSSESQPILHGANISPYVRKVRVALAYKGIEYGKASRARSARARNLSRKALCPRFLVGNKENSFCQTPP